MKTIVCVYVSWKSNYLYVYSITFLFAVIVFWFTQKITKQNYQAATGDLNPIVMYFLLALRQIQAFERWIWIKSQRLEKK